MRHRKQNTKLNRSTAHRQATLSMIAKSLFIHQSIKTTLVKAKAARKLAEHLITVSKRKNLSSRRRIFSILKDRTVTKRLCDELCPLFENRHGGYTRVTRLKIRRGDGAQIVLLELTEKIPEKTPDKKAKPAKLKKQIVPQKEEVKKASQKEHPTAAPEVRQEVQEEKAVEDVKKDRAKKEVKKIEKNNFFNKFFRRRTNM